MLYQMMDCPQEEALQDSYRASECDDAALLEEMEADGTWGYDDEDGLDSPTDFDEYEMNADDSFEDPRDPYDMEYDYDL